ncbi:LacI family DNA-binding transcriptional regulator [Martelella alba]|uniref:LacI family DNA-binding transcriptional regulator n=1 Tax=Martelella alba TaxID=2590451 RepID=UPI0038B2BF79
MKQIQHRRRTLRDVAKAAGVSLSTASNALNGVGRVNAETRDRVAQIAQEIGFRPNALARSLLSHRSLTIGIITDDTYGRLTLPISSGVSEVLVDHGVSAFLCATSGDRRLAQLHLQALLDKQVDGIIFTAIRLDSEPPIDLHSLTIPVVYAFAIGPKHSTSFVPDDAHGARLAISHLQQAGCRDILHITGPRAWLAARIRAEAYQQSCPSSRDVMFGDWSEEWGHEAIDQLLSSGTPLPDGIFCGSDEIARGVIDALRDRTILVPDDIRIIGFDNWEVVSRQTRPPLTTIDMELKEIGHRAGLAMLDLTRGEPVATGIVRLPCSLVSRKSVGAEAPDAARE